MITAVKGLGWTPASYAYELFHSPLHWEFVINYLYALNRTSLDRHRKSYPGQK